MHKPKILVTSAGGHTGTPAVYQLLDKGYPVRAFMRRDDIRAQKFREAGAEVIIGNQLDIRDLRKALQGVHRAFHVPPFGPNLLHSTMLFAVAAEEAKLEVATHLGAWNPHPIHPAVHQREQWIASSIYRWMPSVDFVHLNPGIFAFTYFLGLPLVAQLGVLALPYGYGLNAPPSNEDIARVAVATLLRPESHIGKSYRPTGPRLISGEDAAISMARALNRNVKYLAVSNEMFIKAALAQGFSNFEVSHFRYFAEETRKGAYAIGAPTEHVLEVTGRPPEDFDTIARRYAQLPEAKRTVANKLRAITLFMKMLATRIPDFDLWEQRRDHPLITNGLLAQDNQDWLATAKRQEPNVFHSRLFKFHRPQDTVSLVVGND